MDDLLDKICGDPRMTVISPASWLRSMIDDCKERGPPSDNDDPDAWWEMVHECEELCQALRLATMLRAEEFAVARPALTELPAEAAHNAVKRETASLRTAMGEAVTAMLARARGRPKQADADKPEGV